MTQELIENVKLNGELIRIENVTLRDDKFCTLTLWNYNNLYYVIQTVLDNYQDVCHYEDGDEFTNNDQALLRFNAIIEDYTNIENGN